MQMMNVLSGLLTTNPPVENNHSTSAEEKIARWLLPSMISEHQRMPKALFPSSS
jgi:hypothetical protein